MEIIPLYFHWSHESSVLVTSVYHFLLIYKHVSLTNNQEGGYLNVPFNGIIACLQRQAIALMSETSSPCEVQTIEMRSHILVGRSLN